MSDRIKQNNDKNEITKSPPHDKRAVILSNDGIEIRREGKAINCDTTENGIVYLLIDCSSSMTGDKLDQAKKGAMNFAKEARIKGYVVGLIQFADAAIHLCEPQQEIPTSRRYLEMMRAEGYTNMAEALHLMQIKNFWEDRYPN